MILVDVAEERNEILKRYRRLLRQAKPILKSGDTKLIKKAFTISDDVVVNGADMKDGILKIEMERIIPEEKKPRTIKIK